MTTLIQERRHDGNVLAGFLILIFAIAAWRGASSAPVVAVILGLLALGTLLGWASWRRKPPSELKVSPDEVTWGAPDRVVRTIPRSAEPLALRRNAARQTAWWLAARDDSQVPSISLIGFDPAAVRQACVDNGWQFLD